VRTAIGLKPQLTFIKKKRRRISTLCKIFYTCSTRVWPKAYLC